MNVYSFNFSIVTFVLNPGTSELFKKISSTNLFVGALVATTVANVFYIGVFVGGVCRSVGAANVVRIAIRSVKHYRCY